jgi:hypothetical protein
MSVAGADEPAAVKASSQAAEGKETPAKSTNGSAPAKPASGRRTNVTPEREAAAVTFVRMNHPELADLLAQLKKTKPKAYESAVRELYRAYERLEQAKDRDPERHQLELEAWKLKSQLHVLQARGSMTSAEAIEEELRRLLARQADVQLAQLQLERQRAAARLEKLDDSIAELQRDREAQLERQLQAARGSIERARGAAARGNGQEPPRAGPSTGT